MRPPFDIPVSSHVPDRMLLPSRTRFFSAAYPNGIRQTIWVVFCLVFLGTTGLHSAAHAQTTQLRIATDPPNARIFRNGRLEDTAPLTLTDLTPGQHLISAQLPGYHEKRTTITLEPGQRMALDLKLTPITGLVLIHSTPQGADITVNGAHRGQTPILLTNLRLGTYRAQAVKPEYLPIEVEIEVTDRTPKKIEIDLRPDAARLHFDSTPRGARIIIDGISHGITPHTVDRVPTGERTLEVRMEGHQPFQQTLPLAAGDERDIHAILDPLPGALNLISIPEGARIYIDDERRGETPLQLDNLLPGDYTVRAEHRGYATETATLTVRNDETTTHEFRLQRDSGTLVLTTEPAGVRVLVDGEEAGRTQPGESDVLSLPLTIDYIAEGERTLELVREGYTPMTLRLAIEAGRTVTRHESLRRRFIPDTRVRIGDGPGGVLTGVVVQRFPNGDIVLETRPGIFRTIEAGRIQEIGPIREDMD